MPLSLNINGEIRFTAADPLSPLVDVLRDEFFLTGAKAVCREGFCGACTVLLSGSPGMSCLVPVGLAADREIRTVELLAADGVLSPLQQAMERYDAVQCGMCFPGMMMSLTHFLEHTPHASRDEIKGALTGNICRCTGYERIVEAALSVGEASRRGGRKSMANPAGAVMTCRAGTPRTSSAVARATPSTAPEPACSTARSPVRRRRGADRANRLASGASRCRACTPSSPPRMRPGCTASASPTIRSSPRARALPRRTRRRGRRGDAGAGARRGGGDVVEMEPLEAPPHHGRGACARRPRLSIQTGRRR